MEGYPKAGLFELFKDGFNTPFEILVACIISIRTTDEVMLPVARQLFARARTPAEAAALTPAEIAALITRSNYYENKAAQIHEIARRSIEEFGGDLPCDFDALMSLRGVGPKCANLTLGIACGQPRIGVDVHVHRVANRWGYVRTRTPEESLAALETKVPLPYWIDLNRLVMPFGKFICTGNLPRCSTCPVLDMCPRIGVTAHR